MRTRLFVAAASTLVLTACTTSAGGGAPAISTAQSLAPGQGTSVALRFKGTGAHPSVTVSLPAGWTQLSDFVVGTDTDGSQRAVAFWDVGKVARDPCHSLGRLYDPGATVTDLVGALQAQIGRRATTPTSTTLAGYPATALQWSVPADLTVTGDSDFVGCDLQSNGHRDYVSWEGAGGEGERFQQMPGQVDRLWILHVNGQRLVVDASHSPGTTPAQLAEIDRVIASVQLQPAGA